MLAKLQERYYFFLHSDRRLISLIKEMNGKWNAVVRLIEKEYGATPIIRDGYKMFMIHEIPELDGHI